MRCGRIGEEEGVPFKPATATGPRCFSRVRQVLGMENANAMIYNRSFIYETGLFLVKGEPSWRVSRMHLQPLS
jgi:hypothetical protein